MLRDQQSPSSLVSPLSVSKSVVCGEVMAEGSDTKFETGTRGASGDNRTGERTGGSAGADVETGSNALDLSLGA